MAQEGSARPKIRPFSPGSYSEALRIGEILRKETVGGILLVVAAAVAIVWANSPWADTYFALRDVEFGYEPWHLRLTLGAWAADGLLAIFFFLVGLELKREFVTGDLRELKRAVVPVAAALGGVIAPALLYVAVTWGDADDMRGWAIPTATDIAFAVAVLAVIGSHLPTGLRIFLLTLAVVDDLLAICIIAVFYTSELYLQPLLWSLVPFTLYAVLAHRFRRFFGLNASAAWFILLPVAFGAWTLVHASGIHATVAGVLLGFAVPVIRSQASGGPGAGPGLSEIFEHRFRPLSAGFAVPVFAFLSAGVALGGFSGLGSALQDPVTVGIMIGLVVGKPVGITAATWLVTKLSRAELDSSLRWVDVVGVGLLAGIGFTVSLLVAELSFLTGDPAHDHAKVAILLSSVSAAVLATLLLTVRNRHYRSVETAEMADVNADGVPDIYQRPTD